MDSTNWHACDAVSAAHYAGQPEAHEVQARLKGRLSWHPADEGAINWRTPSRYEFQVRSVAPAAPAAPAVKVRWTLMPWRALASVARVLTGGAAKHGDRDFDVGGDDRDALDFDAAMRHIAAHVAGTTRDEESGEQPLAHAAARLLMIVERTCK